MIIIINVTKYVILLDIFSPKRFPIVFFIIFLNACPPSKGNNGKELKYHYVEQKKKKKKKYENLIEKITSYRNEYEINKSNCIKLLELNEDIKIGRETLKKIMENKY